MKSLAVKVVIGASVFFALLALALYVAYQSSARAQSPLDGLEAVVYKSASCGCCGAYIAFLREQGVDVEVVNTEEMSLVKAANGVAPQAQSCHTAQMDGYVVEGHVPLAALEQLFELRPALAGIALPGMPTGSPGMGGPKTAPFEVLSFTGEGLEFFGNY